VFRSAAVQAAKENGVRLANRAPFFVACTCSAPRWLNAMLVEARAPVSAPPTNP
jgi:hypothetical protein